jgi:predicted enzyme related to lactoylglutathione lyase
MIHSIAFFAYPVSDMASARHFYEDVLGLKMARSFQDEWIEYDVGDTTFAIATADAKHVVGAKGGTIAFEVDDLDAFVKQLKDRNARFVTEITASPVCRSAIVEDPDANEVIIHKRHSA